MKDTFNMSVSPVFSKDGKNYAFVTFDDGVRSAEGKIPECTILSSKGFSKEEITQLEDYMRKELTNLKKMASSVNVWSALMKD